MFHLSPKHAYGVGVAFILLISCLRIVSTYGIFTQTYDEPAHIAAGMELLDRGTYHYDPQHTPLARLAVAIGPRLAGAVFPHSEDMWKDGNAILSDRGAYWRNLSLARAGILPFFVLACLAVWGLARRIFGRPTALLATLLFSCLPPVLGHAGIATTDMACTATYLTAVWSFLWWLDRPTPIRSAGLAAAVAAALLTRLSSLPFLVLGFATIFLLFATDAERRTGFARSFLTRKWQSAAVFCGTLGFLILACYGFAFGPVLDHAELARARTMNFGFSLSPALKELQYRVVSIPIPASPVFRGMYRLYEHNGWGHESYLFGENRKGGWWYFFLVVVAVKTPLGFLLLALAGVVMLVRQKDWQRRSVVAAALIVLLVCSSSRIHLGVRHILPMYPFLAIAAACAAIEFWRLPAFRFVPLLAVAWFLYSSGAAHPDYLSYFNELARSRPERILCESDLDWGQDLHRLSLRLQALGVRDVKIKYAGSADLAAAGLPHYEELEPYSPATGYIAVSMRRLYLEDAKARAQGRQSGPYAWLESYEPLERIGASILLYKL